MKNIKLSIKIINSLIRKLNLTSWEEIEEAIEKSILEYYNIKIYEIAEEDCNSEHFVYIYLDPTKKGKWYLNNIRLKKEPMYVGKGKGTRHLSHLCYATNDNLEKRLNYLKKENIDPEILITDINLTNLLAYNIENKYIAELRNQGVNLSNLTKQSIDKHYPKEIIIKKLNLEKHKNNLVLLSLNNSRTKSEAAKKLDISVRTLYRKIKNLYIVKNKNNEYIYDKTHLLE